MNIGQTVIIESSAPLMTFGQTVIIEMLLYLYIYIRSEQIEIWKEYKRHTSHRKGTTNWNESDYMKKIVIEQIPSKGPGSNIDIIP